MKWAHRLLGLLLGVLLTAALFRTLLPALQGGEVWAEFLGGLEARRLTVVVWLLLSLLGLVAYVLTAMRITSGPKYLAYETQHGNISISLRALQDFLSHLKKEFPSVLSLTPHVSAQNEGLDVTLEIKVKAGSPIPEISRMLQERARLLIEQKIGIADIRNMEVKVEEIVNEKEVASQEIKPMPPPAGEVP